MATYDINGVFERASDDVPATLRLRVLGSDNVNLDVLDRNVAFRDDLGDFARWADVSAWFEGTPYRASLIVGDVATDVPLPELLETSLAELYDFDAAIDGRIVSSDAVYLSDIPTFSRIGGSEDASFISFFAPELRDVGGGEDYQDLLSSIIGFRTIEDGFTFALSDVASVDPRDEFGGTHAVDDVRFGAGDDFAILRGGNDVALGQGGDDDLYGGGGRDRLIGGNGGDKLVGGRGGDELIGGRGRDQLKGQRGHDELSGGRGRDRLEGGTGRDRLDGGAGHDVLTGGKGPDTFVFSGGKDRIMDFDAADSIELSAAMQAALAEGHEIGLKKGAVVLALTDGDSIRFAGVKDIDLIEAELGL